MPKMPAFFLSGFISDAIIVGFMLQFLSFTDSEETSHIYNESNWSSDH
jgi:hypothetical protein